MTNSNLGVPLLLSLLGLGFAGCSGGGGGGSASLATGRISGRAVVDSAATVRLKSSAPRQNDDDALRARDLGDPAPGAASHARGAFDDRNRADWMRAVMTKTGSARVQLTCDAEVALTVYRLRQGHAPSEPLAVAHGSSTTAHVAVGAGDHLLLAVQGEAGIYELELENDGATAPMTVLPATALAAATASVEAALPEVVPGDVIIRGADDAGVAAAQRIGFEVVSRRDDIVRLRSVAGIALRDDSSGRAALADALFQVRRAVPGAQWVEPNLMRQATRLLPRLPNDQLFASQWAPALTNLTQAWDTTIGQPIVIAVVDSGILKNHPDLRDNVLPDGFDFASDPQNGDGDGIDADPEDVLVRGNVFHGSHVAGIAGAVTDNGAGIAGVNWNVRILPVRALGPRGGSDFDVAEAIRYAARLPNVSQRLPAQAARIINLSLGGPSDSQVIRDAVRAAAQAGAILVVSAGNEAQQGNPMSFPAAYEEVIAVGAVGPSGNRAPYSQIQDYVDVAAPGGDVSQREEDGILSTVVVERDNQLFFGFAFYQGTSMAAPFVAGAISLMLSVNSELTFRDVMTILAQTSRDRGALGRDPEFGFGLIDVAAAVAAARNGKGGGGGGLILDRTQIEFTPAVLTASLRITSAPSREISGLDARVVGEVPVGLSGALSSDSTPATMTLEVTPQLASRPQTFTIEIFSTVTQERVELPVRIVSAGGGALTTFVAELLDVNGEVVRVVRAPDGAFAFEEVVPGRYRVRAGIDRDGNGRITDVGDFLSEETAVDLAPGGAVDSGTLRASRNETDRSGNVLTGSFGHSSFGSGASNNIIYTFRADGIVDRQRIFSSSSGTFSSEARGTFTVTGDKVTIRIAEEVEEGTIERANGVIRAIRIGADRYVRV